MITLATDQGVAPLLYRRWQESGILGSHIPPEIVDQLASLYYASLVRNTTVLKQLIHLQGILTDICSPIVLKGVALAAMLYPHPATRPTDDLDLLVAPREYRQALNALTQAGYEPSDFEAQRDYESIQEFPGKAIDRLTNNQLCLRSCRPFDVTLELHWSVLGAAGDWRRPDEDWFLKRTMSFPVNQAEVRTLNPTAQLLYLCAHLSLSHGGSQARLIWLYDLHVLMQRLGPQIDWQAVTAAAKKFEWGGGVVQALHWTNLYLETEIAADTLGALQGATTARSIKLLEDKAREGSSRWRRLRNQVFVFKVGTRLKIIWQHFVPPRAYVLKRYPWCPAWLWPLAYGYRWGIAVKEFFSALRRAS